MPDHVRVRRSRSSEPRCAEHGQAGVEYAGALVLVAAIVAGLFAVGLPTSVARAVACSMNTVFDTTSHCASAAPTANPPTPPPTPGAGPPAGPTPKTPGAGPSAAPTPKDPWYVSTFGGNRSCPPGYYFHIASDGFPWCANSSVDKHPTDLYENPSNPPCPRGLTCVQPQPEAQMGGTPCPTTCTHPPDIWTPYYRYEGCLTYGSYICKPPQRMPAVGPVDPNKPDGPYQIFPYGLPQEEAYDKAWLEAYKTWCDKLDCALPGDHEWLEKQAEWEAAQAGARAAQQEASTPGAISRSEGDGSDGELPDPEPPEPPPEEVP